MISPFDSHKDTYRQLFALKQSHRINIWGNKLTPKDLTNISNQGYDMFITQTLHDPNLSQYRSALSSRFHTHLWADIDVKVLTDDTARFNAFYEAVCDTLHQPSYITSSGSGYHLYWLFSSPEPSPDCEPLEYGLIHHLNSLGFGRFDAVADSARVLRLRNSYNYKYSPPIKCEALQQYSTDNTYCLDDFTHFAKTPPLKTSKAPIELHATLELGRKTLRELKDFALQYSTTPRGRKILTLYYNLDEAYWLADATDSGKTMSIVALAYQYFDDPHKAVSVGMAWRHKYCPNNSKVTRDQYWQDMIGKITSKKSWNLD